MNLVDLHVHSNYSDGTLTPTELVSLASQVGLCAFALTDHDTIAGVSEAMEAAATYGVRVIPGIEMSTTYTTSEKRDKEVHIVGLFIDTDNAELVSELDNQVRTRNERNDKIITAMNEAGFAVSLKELREAFGENTILTRAHFAAFMVMKGYVKDRNQAFDRYFGDGKPFHIPRERMSPAKAISLINGAGGIAILAHPILYNLPEKELDRMCASLKRVGLTGIEALYSTYRNGDETLIRKLAKNNGLLISGGSDFHGENKPYIHLGTGKGTLKVPEEVLINLEKSIK